MYYNYIMIINTFKNENYLRIKYPKTQYFKLKDVFITCWDKFVKFSEYKNLYIRDVVFRDVEKMMICNSPKLGSSVLNALIVVIINLFIILVNLDFVILVALNTLNNVLFLLNLS